MHCGYRPVEINASDDRSAGALQSRVLDAVEMQARGVCCAHQQVQCALRRQLRCLLPAANQARLPRGRPRCVCSPRKPGCAVAAQSAFGAAAGLSATRLASPHLRCLQSVMGQRRPNCVVIDEIDGATGGKADADCSRVARCCRHAVCRDCSSYGQSTASKQG